MIKYRNATNATATVGNSSTTVLAANEARKRAIIVNSGANGVWLSFGATAVVGQGAYLAPAGGSFEIDPDELYTGAIKGIAAAGSNVVGVVEFY
jgi:hypothetical protein